MMATSLGWRCGFLAAAGLLLAAGWSGAQAQVTGQPSPARPPARPASAATDQAFAVGIIDIGAVLHDSTAAQDLQRQMQAQQDNYQGAFDKQQRELRSVEEDIERDRSSLSAEAYAEKRRAFQERVTKAAGDFRARRRQLEAAFGAGNAQINKTLAAIIDELANKSGLNIVVRREAVLFQKGVVDITQPAIGLLNARLPNIAIAIPPPPS